MTSFPSTICDKARNLFIELLRLGHYNQLADAVLAISFSKKRDLLGALAALTPSISPDVPGVSLLILAIQKKSPQLMCKLFSLEAFCQIIAPCNGIFLSSGEYLGKFFDTRSDDRSSKYVSGCLIGWDPPADSECLENFLLNCSKHEHDLKTVIDYIVSAVRPLESQCPSLQDTESQFEDAPQQRATKLHYPVYPLLFASHLTFRSKPASSLIIDSGLLQLLGHIWAFDFPDPWGRTTSELTQVRNDMRVACLALFVALTFHYPSTRDFTDHLLRAPFSCRELEPSGNQSVGRLHIVFPVLPVDAWVDPSNAAASLTLSFSEICVANHISLIGSEEHMRRIVVSILS